ncbi:reverse transcriptase domain-containing protein, partial [Tanacetum coccineum]
MEQISAAFLSDESSAMIQNKVPPKLGDPGSFLILCNFNKTFSCNALADLGASINLMPYSLYAKLSLETLKPTKMNVRLADRSFQYPVGIAKNMLVEVVIQVKQKQLNLGVGTERMIFNIDSAMEHSYLNDDTCFSIDVIDEILEEDFDALLNEGRKILHSIKGTLLEKEIFAEFDEFKAMTANENSNSESDTEKLPFEKITVNTDYHAGLEVDKAKINVITKLPPSTNIKGIRSFLGHAGFYRRFIKYISKITRPRTKLLEKDIPFEFDDECQKAFELLKEKLTCAPVIVSPNWNLPFELMCDASDFAVRAVLGQKDGKNFHPIYFASKTLNPAQQKYTVTEKELMAIVFAFNKFRSYLILSKTIVHTDHSALRKGIENVAADHLSRIENDETCEDSEVDDNFPGE